MQSMPDNVRHEIVKMVPSSVVNEIACFVFYDNHPVQRKFCDITVCTVHGEVKEYYKREKISSLLISNDFKASQIRIMRNIRGVLFYLVASASEVVILSRKEKLRVHQRVTNVDYFDVEDSVCRGQACLKIVQKDDAVPLIFDDKFENLGERAHALSGIYADESLPILTELQRKLTQAKYSIKCNEKTHREFQDLRKLTAFAAYQKSHANLDDSLFHGNLKEESEALKLRSLEPQVKICNQKIVITLHAVNKNKEPLTDVTVLLHAKKPSIVYATKLFERTTSSPFWKLVSNTLQPEAETAIVVVVDLSELQYHPASKVEFNGALSYQSLDKKCLMPFEYVVIPHFEVMGKQFDVLAQDIDDNSILSVLATTEKIDLSLRIISNVVESVTPLPDLFCRYLEMDSVKNVYNAVIHKKSLHHLLNGVLVIFDENETPSNTVPLSLYVRSYAQVLPFIHYIHEAIPFRIVLTSQNHRITTTIESLHSYNEEIPKSIQPKLNYNEYSHSALKQTEVILQHLDSCIVKMNTSKEAAKLSKIGKEIDLFAGGLTSYTDFRTKLLEEALKGVKCLKIKDVTVPVSNSGTMALDD